MGRKAISFMYVTTPELPLDPLSFQGPILKYTPSHMQALVDSLKKQNKLDQENFSYEILQS